MLRDTLDAIKPLDKTLIARAQTHLDSLTKPQGSLGLMEAMAARMVAIYGIDMPQSGPRKVVFTFAADHGVTEEGVSAFPREVTAQMVLNFLRGGAGINVLARHAGADVAVVDIGVDHDFGQVDGLISRKIVRGTRNMCKGPAMMRLEALASIEAGIELAHEYYQKGYRMFGTGDMGIGNTTPSTAIAAVYTGRSVDELTGRGTGISDQGLKVKADAIKRALALNTPDAADPIDVLAKVGGAEIGGIAGVCLAGAALRVPVVVDGFISTAGALIAHALNPSAAEYFFAAHLSAEGGHRAMLERMGLVPILNLGLRLGEGTGAALAMPILEASIKIYREMATFGQAGVSEKAEHLPCGETSS